MPEQVQRYRRRLTARQKGTLTVTGDKLRVGTRAIGGGQFAISNFPRARLEAYDALASFTHYSLGTRLMMRMRVPSNV